MCRKKDGRISRLKLAATLLAAAACIPSIDLRGAESAALDNDLADAWRLLRAVDCARCHGRNYTGSAAPSIVDYAATQSRDTFARMVLDGDPARGMPGYRDNPKVADNIDAIYRYFRARAEGRVGPDERPSPPEKKSP